MKQALASDDPITRVMNGRSVDYVPVAPAYEMLGPLQFHRMELRWRKWWERLDRAGTDLLPVDYATDLDLEFEIATDLLEGPYPPPAWLSLPRSPTSEEIRGCAVARRGRDLFWLSARGDASWIPPNREAEQEAAVADRSMPYADLWDRSGNATAIRRAATRPMHEFRPAPQPLPQQAEALAGSERYGLAISLAERYPDGLALYTDGFSPYNGLEGLFGFQDMMYALAESPDLVHRVLDNWLPGPSARLAAERQLGITLMFVEECMSSADIISPRMYQEFAFPYTKQALELYESMGFRTVLYFSGNLMPFLGYLADLPFTALSFEEDRKNYGIDLAEVRRALRDKVLFGNVDAAWLERASDQEVLDEVKRQIEVAGPDRFILSVGSPLTPGTSLERVRFFCESTRMI